MIYFKCLQKSFKFGLPITFQSSQPFTVKFTPQGKSGGTGMGPSFCSLFFEAEMILFDKFFVFDHHAFRKDDPMDIPR